MELIGSHTKNQARSSDKAERRAPGCCQTRQTFGSTNMKSQINGCNVTLLVYLTTLKHVTVNASITRFISNESLLTSCMMFNDYST